MLIILSNVGVKLTKKITSSIGALVVEKRFYNEDISCEHKKKCNCISDEEYVGNEESFFYKDTNKPITTCYRIKDRTARNYIVNVDTFYQAIGLRENASKKLGLTSKILNLSNTEESNIKIIFDCKTEEELINTIKELIRK